MGRERELTDLQGGLRDALGGRGRLFLIAGEPGIGKTRLADEFTADARERGCRILWGRCWEAGGAPVYWPWVQSIRGYVREAEPETLRSQLGSGAPQVAQMLPELRDVLPDIGPPSPLDPETARFQLFDATMGFLRSAAADRPLVFVLDDLHAADTPSILLLQFIARELPGTRLVIVGTYRDTELGRDRVLASALAELTREPATRSMFLTGLNQAEVGEFIEQSTGMSPGPNAAAAVHGESEGNPLFVAEVVRLLEAEGRLTGADASAWSANIPRGLGEIIGRRLGHLSEDCVRVLTLGSVFGREFRMAALQRISGMRPGSLLDALEEAATARVIAEMPGGPDAFRFSHQIIRDTLYEELPATRRVRLHQHAGETLENLYEQNPEPHLAELAHHFLKAAAVGGGEKSIDYANRAGDRAIKLLAYEEATRLFEAALGVAELGGGSDLETRCELLLSLGDALTRSGDTPRAKEAFMDAAAIAKREGMPEQLARTALGYGGRFVWEASREDPNLAVLLRDALDALPKDDSELRVRVMARLAGGPLRDEVDRGPRDVLSRDAVEMARRLGDSATLAYGLDGRYAAVWWPDNIDHRLEVATELIEASQRANDRERTLQGYHYRCFAYLELGDTAAALTDVDAQASLAEELKQPTWLTYVTTVRAAVATLLGDFREAERLIPEAHLLGVRAEASMADIYRAIGLFNLRREQGRLPEVEDLLTQTIRRFPTYFVLRCALAATYCESARWEEAQELFKSLAADRFVSLPLNDEWLYGVGVLADVAASLEDVPRAEVLYELLLPYANRAAVSPPDGCTGSISRNLGVLASLLQRWEDAERHFQVGVDVNKRMGARPWIARTQHEHASMLLRRGVQEDEVRAVQLLSEALHIYRELSLGKRAGEVAALLEELGAPPETGIRATKTFMFTDIASSTNLLETIGDEAWEELLRWHDRRLRSIFSRFRGQELDHAGDGFLAAFDDPERALQCAVAIQQALAEHRREHGFAPQVRIGVHSGEATVIDGKYAGKAVHEASRIAAQAESGQILASRGTAMRAPGVVATDPRHVRLKGLAAPVEIVEVAWQQTSRTRESHP